MIKIVIADDHNLVRQGIRAVLERTRNIKVVGEAGTGLQAHELVRKLRPEVLVTDIAMPELNGIELIKRVRSPGCTTEVVVLSMYSDETLIRQALHHGARGYVLKSSVSEELVLAVHAVTRGEIFLSSDLSSYLAVTPDQTTPQNGPLDSLTPRERMVLQLVAEGHTNKAIADKLTISERTVEKHRANLMHKLHVPDIASLVRLALRHGIIFDSPHPLTQ
ncbi:MAG: Oxygen regulatory protein NreC [Verrucomicrobiae bacterium]|nr:Oxygen regulatory protein NreC [Verrucomicrobiae bacterium]